jgi:hypothetical protein
MQQFFWPKPSSDSDTKLESCIKVVELPSQLLEWDESSETLFLIDECADLLLLHLTSAIAPTTLQIRHQSSPTSPHNQRILKNQNHDHRFVLKENNF